MVRHFIRQFTISEYVASLGSNGAAAIAAHARRDYCCVAIVGTAFVSAARSRTNILFCLFLASVLPITHRFVRSDFL